MLTGSEILAIYPKQSVIPITCHMSKCLACNHFPDVEHYKSEWHRYNLRRRVAELDPVSLEDFETKQMAALPSIKKENQKYYCVPCKKRFSSVKALDVHLGSKKHINSEDCIRTFVPKPKPKFEEKTPQELIMERRMLTLDECFFCGNLSQNVEQNLIHMRTHGFCIPYQDKLLDLNGLLTYLASKICLGFACLECHTQDASETGLFRSLAAVRNHMHDKQHYAIPDNDEQIMEFFDREPNLELRVDDLMQLVLKEKVVGNRQYQIYYKQNLRELVPNSIKTITPISEEKKEFNKQHQKFLKQQMQLGVHTNSLQRYFREQIL